MSLISVQNLSFSYGNKIGKVLNNVSFDIEEGSYTAIVGSNGSGKSTLSRIICGLEPLQEGTINFEKEVSVGLVFQSPKNQLVSSIIYRDTAFGPQNLGLPKSEIELRTIECLNITEMLDKAEKSTASISLGQTQKVALSGMLAIWPKVIFLDESVSMLDPESRENIFEFLRYWHKKGHTIIHITHDMDAIYEADRIIELEKGEIIFDGSKASFICNSELVKKISGQELEKASRSASLFREPSLRITNVDFGYSKMDDKSSVHNIDFTLYKGTLTALTGPSGAGKSTILEICAGLIKPENGRVYCNSKPALAFQNSSNALFEPFAADDVAFGPKNQGIKGKELKERVVSSMKAVNLPVEEFGERHPLELSGGQQRRLAIAGIIALNKDVIFFDEPSAGLDGHARYEVMQLLRSLANEGKTVVFSTHHKDEAAFADRELCVEQGRIVKDSVAELNIEEAETSLEEMSTYEAVNMLEGLRKMSSSLSGENKKKKAPVEKMPPALRILLFLSLFVASLAARTWYITGAILLLTFIYCKLCGCSLKTVLKNFLKILPFLLFFSLLQLIFHPAVENEIHFTEWKWFLITPSKLLFCLESFFRTVAAMASICGFFVSTPEFDLIDGMKILLKPLELIKIPVRYFILILEIIFRFIPLLVDEAYSIIKTQVMRGGLGKTKGKLAKIKAIIPLFVPLTIQTVRRSEALADAITMRCFK